MPDAPSPRRSPPPTGRPPTAAERRPVAVKTQSGGSAERPGSPAGLERRLQPARGPQGRRAASGSTRLRGMAHTAGNAGLRPARGPQVVHCCPASSACGSGAPASGRHRGLPGPRNRTSRFTHVAHGPATPQRSSAPGACGSGAPVSDRHRGRRPRNSGPVAGTRNEDDEATYARAVVAAPFPLARAPSGGRKPWSFARCAGDAGRRPALHCRPRFGRIAFSRQLACHAGRSLTRRNGYEHRIASSDMCLTAPTAGNAGLQTGTAALRAAHVVTPPAGTATNTGSAPATCPHPADSASATCTPRRTRYCDM